MESLYERISDSAPDAVLVAAHVVFLATDINDGTAGAGGVQTEVGTSLLVNLGEVVAWYGGLCDKGVFRHVERFLYLIAHQLEHLLAIAGSQLTIARGIEVQFVRTIGASRRRDDMCRVDGLGQFLDLFHTADADTLTVGLYHLTNKQWGLLRLQLQVTQHVVINLLYHTSPLGVASVGLALVHQHTLDDTILLSLLGQCDESFIGVIVVGGQHGNHPSWCLLHVVLDAVGQETLDVNTANGHVDDANADILRQRLDHRATKPVGRCQTRIRAAEWGRGFAPLPHLAASLRIVNGWHEQETGTRTGDVLCLRLGCSLHVRLSEAEEDVEIGIYFCRSFRKRQEHKCCQQHIFEHLFHCVMIVYMVSGCKITIIFPLWV